MFRPLASEDELQELPRDIDRELLREWRSRSKRQR
jgi:hypothetical protein